jgi:hypothetical protein
MLWGQDFPFSMLPICSLGRNAKVLQAVERLECAILIVLLPLHLKTSSENDGAGAGMSNRQQPEMLCRTLASIACLLWLHDSEK